MRRHFPFVLLILIGLFAAYGSTLFARYGYGDDYAILGQATSGNARVLIDACAGMGRLLFGPLLALGFRAAGSVERLALLRLVSLLLIQCVGLLVYAHLLRHTRSRVLSAAVALFVCTLAPFQVYAFWATTAPALIAILLTYPAYRLLSAPFTWWRLAGTVVLLWTSLNVYQPGAMFLWFWLAAELLPAPLTWSDLWRRLLRFVPPVLLSFAVYAAVFKLSGFTHPRSHFTADPIRKCVWFARDVIPCTFRFQLILAPPLVGTLILAFIVVTLVAVQRRRALPKLALAAILLPLSYAPNLGAGESWSTYRTQAGLMPVAALLLCYALVTLADSLAAPRRRRPVGAWAAVGSLAAAAVVLAAFNVDYLVVQPQNIEFRLAQARLRKFDAHTQHGILLIQPDWKCLWFGRYQLNRHFDEFATPSTIKPKDWGIASSFAWFALRSARHDLHLPARQTIPITVYNPYDHTPPPNDPSLFVLDMRELKLFR